MEETKKTLGEVIADMLRRSRERREKRMNPGKAES